MVPFEQGPVDAHVRVVAPEEVGVVAEHDGTPWALVATEELRVPLGYRWTESHTGVNDPKMQDGNGNPVPTAPSDDKKRMLAPPKPKRDLKRL